MHAFHPPREAREYHCRRPSTSDVRHDQPRQGTEAARRWGVEETDFLVIGSGVAGMSFALQVAAHGRVAILTKAAPEDSNSSYAQGGIAAVWSDEDTFETHVEDTLVAGAGLCRRAAVEVTVREGPTRVQDLIDVGAQFTLDDDGGYSLHREGGHTHRRILHAADFTGQ